MFLASDETDHSNTVGNQIPNPHILIVRLMFLLWRHVALPGLGTRSKLGHSSPVMFDQRVVLTNECVSSSVKHTISSKIHLSIREEVDPLHRPQGSIE